MPTRRTTAKPDAAAKSAAMSATAKSAAAKRATTKSATAKSAAAKRAPVSGSTVQRIAGFLAKYTPAIAAQGRAVRKKLRARMPSAVEMVYDNWNGLVFGYSASERPSDAVLSLLLAPDHVTLCFLWGKALPDPHGVLAGGGNQVRHVRLAAPRDLDAPPIRALIAEAMRRSRVPFVDGGPGTTVIRSVSAKQRPRRP